MEAVKLARSVREATAGASAGYLNDLSDFSEIDEVTLLIADCETLSCRPTEKPSIIVRYALIPAIHIIEAYDVIFTEILASLYFNEY